MVERIGYDIWFGYYVEFLDNIFYFYNVFFNFGEEMGISKFLVKYNKILREGGEGVI